ncbi:sulfatase-like hydrolase/transferase [Akkermansiaceae bacterium]|nr:sulfatase-like hydrolase/transferase [Akkermansiaceae bacterium]MDB4300009.1 sulfatase-like hydrolase/transferase [bacterium]MDB0055712.1 sulfatase-like hydrolase/transferase [Akkermansiaceae bacterium]MDB4258434.1 sulfatase-like hydrolase/transferase [Akkermansiaceae bacterium]MDB4262262.1 sulfatase-like hydrolase/transferase [Akkermansiaceae bacterium]
MNFSRYRIDVRVAKTLFTSLLFSLGSLQAESTRPNILLILADDLGYGDLGCYNPDSKIPTPYLDAMAEKGVRFTDAHSPATVCTPTRYSLMTGSMAFRTGVSRVFSGTGGPSMILDERLTIAEMLRDKGYSTACVGKWHVGLTFFDQEGAAIKTKGNPGVKLIDYSRPIKGGPFSQGFDSFFGTACCPTTDWLYAYIVDDRIPVPPTKLLESRTIKGNPYSLDCRRGWIADDFDLDEVDMVFLDKSVKFLEDHAAKEEEKPFFLFHSMQAVHLPSFPAKQFQGKTQSGPHGDFIFQMDHIVGELMKTLERLKLDENTLVIFSSDNGPEDLTTASMRKSYQHDGARPWRGVKRDHWEGGHRVPFIAQWPGVIPAKSTSDQLLSLTDVMATCAAIVDAPLPKEAAEDSFNMLAALKGTAGEKSIRPYLLQQSTRAGLLSIRDGKWKYLDHKGSGGNRYDREGGWMYSYALPEKAPDAPGQLYNLESDPGETTNLYFEKPTITARLKAKLEEFKKSGRSAPLPK